MPKLVTYSCIIQIKYNIPYITYVLPYDTTNNAVGLFKNNTTRSCTTTR
jgi:hypothetical protein